MEKEGVLDNLPHRHLTETEKQYISLTIEKSKLNRERAVLVLDKGILLFFAFLVFIIIALENAWISKTLFNLLVISTVCILVLSVTPYMKIAREEEKKIDGILESLMGK